MSPTLPTTGVHYPPGTGPYGIQVKRELVRRSWVVVSAIDDELVSQAWTWNADVVVLDLEDSVHDSKKHIAREKIAASIPQVAKGGAEVFIRPDMELLYADLEASILEGVTGVVLPKVSSVEQVVEADRIIDEFEAKRALPGVIEIHLSLETGKGNLDAMDIIKASSGVRSIGLGRADLVMDLRGYPSEDIVMMPYLNERLVLIARAAGVEPIGAFWTGDCRGTVASPEATLGAALRGKRHGFRGAMCAQSHQVAALNQAFTPSNEEVKRAQHIVQVFEEARVQGKEWGVLDGAILDWARAQTAKELIVYSQLCVERDEAKRIATKPAR